MTAASVIFPCHADCSPLIRDPSIPHPAAAAAAAIARIAQLVLLTPNGDLHLAIDEQLLLQLAPQFFDQLHAFRVDDALLRLRLGELGARRVCGGP